MAFIGKNIRILRTKSEMTQDDLPEKLFVSRQTISNYEMGKSHPYVDTPGKLAGILGTDVNTLIYGIQTQPEKKREYRNFIITFAITALLIAAALIFKSFAMKYKAQYYTFDAIFVYVLLMKPSIFLSLGYLIMKICEVFFGAKRITGKSLPAIRFAVIGIIALYFIIVAPEVYSSISASFQTLQLHNSDHSFSGEDIKRLYIPIWSQISQWLIVKSSKIQYIIMPVFALAGMFLWATDSRKGAAKSAKLP